MSSVHLYNAEKNDIEDVYNLLVEFKKVDLVDFNYPEIDRTKVIKFLHTILQKGQIILLKELDKNIVIGCCIFYKTEYWYSKSELITIQTVYISKEYRSFAFFKLLIDNVKKVAKNLPIVLPIISGLKIDAVFEKLGFQNMGSNWRID